MHDELITQYESDRLWRQARRRSALQRLMCTLRRCSPDLLVFEADQGRTGAIRRVYRGIREVPIEQIRGSVGRAADFTNLFLPRQDALRQRWQRVLAVVQCDCDPAVELYQIDDRYYVLDGHHRISTQLMSGRDTITAEVWEFVRPG